MDVSSELMVQTKQKTGTGVETPHPRNFLCGMTYNSKRNTMYMTCNYGIKQTLYIWPTTVIWPTPQEKLYVWLLLTLGGEGSKAMTHWVVVYCRGLQWRSVLQCCCEQKSLLCLGEHSSRGHDALDSNVYKLHETLYVWLLLTLGGDGYRGHDA